jgi:hypothetical protein
MSKRFFVIPALAGVFVRLTMANAITVIPQPVASYTSSTSLIDISALTGNVDSITGGGLTVNFSTPMSVLKTGASGGWGTWNSPPATENNKPKVLYSKGATDVDMTLSMPVSTFGFEAQPDLSDTEVMKAAFFDAAGDDLADITLNVSGNAGALLFALSTGMPNITRVDLTDLGPTGKGGCAACDFALAEVRFASVPEPATLLVAAAALLLLATFTRWRRRFRIRST